MHSKILTIKHNNKFIINNKYECIVDDDKPFNEFKRDSNSLSYSASAKLIVDDISEAELVVFFNPGLTCEFSIRLFFIKDGKAISSINISDIEFI